MLAGALGQWRGTFIVAARVALRAMAAVAAAAVLSGCAEIMEPVQGLGDALRGLFESLPF
jgi:hypothetical protein